jgi:transposase-like protein
MKAGTEFWMAHVAAARLEAISASEYARRHGISVTALYYWQRKLSGNVDPPPQAGKFVKLRIADTRQNNFTLALPSGLRLEMSSLPPPEWLVALERSATIAQGTR